MIENLAFNIQNILLNKVSMKPELEHREQRKLKKECRTTIEALWVVTAHHSAAHAHSWPHRIPVLRSPVVPIALHSPVAWATES
jgi:hypothetical protein